MPNTAIITGGTSGLGLEIAQLLHARGWGIVTVSRRGHGDARFTHVSGDASRGETASRAIEAAEALGTLRLLVNSAGVGIYGAAGSYGEETAREIVDANLVATIVFCDAIFPRFAAAGGGTIVNVLSTAAIQTKTNESVYCAAKWGARAYTDVLRLEGRGSHIRVLSVVPGGMQTPFWPSPREGFMDPREIASVVVDAIERPVAVSEIVIYR